MSYTTTDNRLQITTLDGKNPAKAIHEDDGTGWAKCGHRRNVGLDTYKGQQCKFTSLGPGTVTCMRCAATN